MLALLMIVQISLEVSKKKVLLPEETIIIIHNALYYSKFWRNLLNFIDICLNGLCVETMEENGSMYLFITQVALGKKLILEKLPSQSFGLY